MITIVTTECDSCEQARRQVRALTARLRRLERALNEARATLVIAEASEQSLADELIRRDAPDLHRERTAASTTPVVRCRAAVLQDHEADRGGGLLSLAGSVRSGLPGSA